MPAEPEDELLVPTAGTSDKAPARGSTTTRRAALALGLLFALVLLALLAEECALNYTQAQRRRAFAARAEDSALFSHHDDPAYVLNDTLFAPDAWMLQETDPEGEVPADELLHLSLLQTACLDNTAAIVSWTYGKPGEQQQNASANERALINQDDPELLAKLRECPDVDIFLPSGIRGHGYCQDATAYAKYLKSRLLPMWAIDTPLFDPQLNRTVTYHELCPRTPILLFNHYWGGIPESPAFPKQKPVYLMPNIEMYELNEKHYWGVDVVLCKTHVCYDRVTQWYAQEGNPRGAKVFYTRHTSSDVAAFARLHLGAGAIAPKDFENIRFIHTVGGSAHKGTRKVLDCWLSRPDFPQLDLFMDEGNYKGNFELEYGERLLAASHQINLTSRNLDAISFGKVVAEASFFLCTSRMEGYGHYINQARASGGVIVTTNAEPMSELIQGKQGMGVIVDTTRHKDSKMFLGGAYHGAYGLKRAEGLVAQVTRDNICEAVERVIYKTTVQERAAMAVKVRQQYHVDTKYLARRMLQLRQFAAHGSRVGAAALSNPPAMAAEPAASRLRREGDGSA